MTSTPRVQRYGSGRGSLLPTTQAPVATEPPAHAPSLDPEPAPVPSASPVPNATSAPISIPEAGTNLSSTDDHEPDPPTPDGDQPGESTSTETFRPRRGAPKVTPLALARVLQSQTTQPEAQRPEHKLNLTLDYETYERLDAIAGHRKMGEYLRNAADAAISQRIPPQHLLAMLQTLRAARKDRGPKKFTVFFTLTQIHGLEAMAVKARKATATSIMEAIAFAAAMIQGEEGQG